MNAIQPAPPLFQAHWDKSFGDYAPSIAKKVARVAWDVFSILIPIIALVRFGIYKLNQRIVREVILPAANQTREVVDDQRTDFLGLYKTQEEDFPCTMSRHHVVTPDGVRLNAILFRHREAVADTPTVVYFNPNGATSYATPYENLLEECWNREAVCNFAVFDYRGTGDSEGNCRSFDDLVVDGASITQWVRETIGTPSDRTHFYGWSLGAAVAAHVKALDPLATRGLFVSERSLSSSDDMINAHLSRLRTLRWNPLPFIQRLSRWLGQAFDVVPAFQKLVGQRLVVYHRQDPVIPFAASLENRVGRIVHQTLRLEALEEGPMNHHCMPLNAYRNGETLRPALAEIGQFLFT
jgi:pimeloyl-ACP methyl ester carboxylesterase